MQTIPRIAVVIPCFKCSEHILTVLRRIPEQVSQVLIVDDACPEGTGRKVQAECRDPRVRVLFHSENQGVGGAMVTGLSEALKGDADIFVKVDGDGQMDPQLIPDLIDSIVRGSSDYVKGNRFYDLEDLREMPKIRVFGNGGLSFMAKLATGNWSCMDPHNGFIAMHRAALSRVELQRLDRRFFFEVDLLFQMNLIRAKVSEFRQQSRYRDEKSNLRVGGSLVQLPPRYLSRLLRRLFYNYILRDFNYGSIALVSGLPIFLFSLIFGGWHWYESYATHVPASAGTVMLSALTFLVGFQLLLSAIQFDIQNQPAQALQSSYSNRQSQKSTTIHSVNGAKETKNAV